jgi:hypothetical protein
MRRNADAARAHTNGGSSAQASSSGRLKLAVRDRRYGRDVRRVTG